MTIARISITIPGNLLAALDRKAKELDRSRSWVIAEAARRFLDTPPTTVRSSAGVVREPAGPYTVTPGLGASRLEQLKADLALTPTERVRAAERTARAAPRRGRPATNRVLAFDRYEDYLDWQRREDLLP